MAITAPGIGAFWCTFSMRNRFKALHAQRLSSVRSLRFPDQVRDRLPGNTCGGSLVCWKRNDDGAQPWALLHRATHRIPQHASDGRKGRNGGACTRRLKDTHDRSPCIGPLQIHYAEFHSPGNGKSPSLHKDGRIHIPAQTGPHKPVRTFQNCLQHIGNMGSFGVCVADR